MWQKKNKVSMDYLDLPEIPGFTWRAIEINDAGALQNFESDTFAAS